MSSNIMRQPNTDWGMNFAGGRHDFEMLKYLVNDIAAPVLTISSIQQANYNPLASVVKIVPGINMCGKKTHITLLDPEGEVCELPINGVRSTESCDMQIAVKEVAGYMRYTTACKVDPTYMMCILSSDAAMLLFQAFLFKKTYKLIDALLRNIMSSIYAAASPAYSGKVNVGGLTVDIGSFAEGQQFIDFGPGDSIENYFTALAAIGDNMPQVADIGAGELPVYRCEEGASDLAVIMPPGAVPLIKRSIVKNGSPTLHHCEAVACLPFKRGLNVSYEGIRVIPDSCSPVRSCGTTNSNQDRIYQTLLVHMKNGIEVNIDMTITLREIVPPNGEPYYLLIHTLYEAPPYIPTECFLGAGGIRLVGPTANTNNCDDLSTSELSGGGDAALATAGQDLKDIGILEEI